MAVLALLLVAQFLLSVEIFATATLFGAIAIALAARTAASDDEYARIVSAVWPIGAAYAISAVILSPYLYYMLALGVPEGTIFSPKNNAADFLNFLVPTGVNELGRLPSFGAIASYFRADLSESRAYLGLPLLAVVVLFARERWHERDCQVRCIHVRLHLRSRDGAVPRNRRPHHHAASGCGARGHAADR